MSDERPMDPQPKWQEAPSKTDYGTWVGRYQYWRTNSRGEPDVDVDVDEYNIPTDMPNAEPVERDGVWYWRTAGSADEGQKP